MVVSLLRRSNGKLQAVHWIVQLAVLASKQTTWGHDPFTPEAQQLILYVVVIHSHENSGSNPLQTAKQGLSSQACRTPYYAQQQSNVLQKLLGALPGSQLY